MQTGDPDKCHVDRNTHTDSENEIQSLSSLDGQALASKIGLQDNLNRKIIDDKNNNNDNNNIIIVTINNNNNITILVTTVIAIVTTIMTTTVTLNKNKKMF